MKGRQIIYTAEQMAWLEANCLMVISDYHVAFSATFDRHDVAMVNLHALRKRRGWKTGRTGQFEPGQKSWNKGVPCEPGKGGRHPNSRRTQFTPGERRGVAIKLYKPIGTERLSKDGYLERKIHDGMPLQSRWRAVHLVRWEEVNGLLPDHHALKCLDDNKLNTDPSNWETIHRGVLARLNGGRHRKTLSYRNAEPELKPLVMAAAKLKHAAHTARKGGAS